MSESLPPPGPPLRLEYVDPRSLAEHPNNWRRHPADQMDAIRDAIKEVGWAGALLYNERTGRLLDGHGRRKSAIESGTPLVPVLIGNYPEEDEAKILLTLDPIANMAVPDPAAVLALVEAANLQADSLSAIADGLAELAGAEIPEDADPGNLGDEKPAKKKPIRYGVLVDVQNKKDQKAFIRELEKAGRKCRPLNS